MQGSLSNIILNSNYQHSDAVINSNMKQKLLNFATFLLLLLPKNGALSYFTDNNPYNHIVTLDKHGKYQLEWQVDWKDFRVYFNVTVETKGFVGLGLSLKGKMSGADIVIGGVLPNGEPYFSDRHAVGNHLPLEDTSQDWMLHTAWEKGARTFLSFSRSLETCDEEHDLPITEDVTALIWAFGEKDDDLEYHFQNRGVYYTYLLDPDLTPRELQNTEAVKFGQGKARLGKWNVWNISDSQIIPNKDTTYLCSLHKATGNRKQHIVGVTLLK